MAEGAVAAPDEAMLDTAFTGINLLQFSQTQAWLPKTTIEQLWTQMKPESSQRSGSRWSLVVGVVIGVVGFFYFLLVYGSRIDSIEGSAFMVSAAPRRALPLGIAAIFLTSHFGRQWTMKSRVALALTTGMIIWTLALQVLVYQAGYPERRIRGTESSVLPVR